MVFFRYVYHLVVQVDCIRVMGHWWYWISLGSSNMTVYQVCINAINSYFGLVKCYVHINVRYIQLFVHQVLGCTTVEIWLIKVLLTIYYINV